MDRKFLWHLQNIKSEHIKYTVYTLGILFYIFFVVGLNGIRNKWDDMFAITTAFTALLIIAGEVLGRVVSHLIQGACEDRTKLTEDFDGLMKQYKRVKLIEYGHARFPGEQIAFRGKDSKPFYFDFNHEMKGKSFEVPKQIKERSAELMKAHDCSSVYNNINVRLEDCKQSGDTVYLAYSKTMYYDLLITNRAMDYPLEVEKRHTVKSVRQIYEPGPFLSSLSESKLSNHLGFNGFVELADGQIIFVLRNPKVSVGKRRWSPSVSASYKTEYGLNDEREMSAKCMGNAIRREIADELKITVGKNEPLENCIFAFYRDLVEGGKPHFVFYYRVSNPLWTKEYFKEHFKAHFGEEIRKLKATKKWRKMTKEEKNKYLTREDGSKFAFFTLNELKNSAIRANQMVTSNGEVLSMQSDGSVSLALLMKHLTDIENPTKTQIYDWLRKNIRVELAQMPVEKRLFVDNADRLAKFLAQILWGEITVEDAASSDDFITEEALIYWKDKAEEEFKSVLANGPAWIYQEPDAKLSKSDNAPARIRKQEAFNDRAD